MDKPDELLDDSRATLTLEPGPEPWTVHDQHALALAVVEVGDTPRTRRLLRELRRRTLTTQDAREFVAYAEHRRSRRVRSVKR